VHGRAPVEAAGARGAAVDAQPARPGSPAADLETWRGECAAARAIVGGRSLDDTGTRRRDGQPVSVRFVLAHMIAEYARHNGHADLLRERVDGTTGA